MDGDTHSSEEWNGKPGGSLTERAISELLNDDMIPQQHKTAFQQQMKVGWEHLFMGEIASRWRQCWPDKTYWRPSIAHTFMEWGRAWRSHRNSILDEERKDKCKITRLRLKAEAQVWMEAPSEESLIPIQQDRWKQKLLKKAANSDIAFWLKHNRTRRKIVQWRKVLNIVATLTEPEALKAANTSFFATILHAKCTMVQDGRMDEQINFKMLSTLIIQLFTSTIPQKRSREQRVREGIIEYLPLVEIFRVKIKISKLTSF